MIPLVHTNYTIRAAPSGRRTDEHERGDDEPFPLDEQDGEQDEQDTEDAEDDGDEQGEEP